MAADDETGNGFGLWETYPTNEDGWGGPAGWPGHTRGGLGRSCGSLQLGGRAGRNRSDPSFGADPRSWITLRRRNSPTDLGSLCPTRKMEFPALTSKLDVGTKETGTKALVLVGARCQSPHRSGSATGSSRLPSNSFPGHSSFSSENSPRKVIINGHLVSLCKRKWSLRFFPASPTHYQFIFMVMPQNPSLTPVL